MKQNIDSLNEFAKKLKSGLIYEEIESKLKDFHSKKNTFYRIGYSQIKEKK